MDTNGSAAAHADVTLGWIDAKYPELGVWRDYAVRWLATSKKNPQDKILYLRFFFEQYLLRLSLPLEVSGFLQAGMVWPNFSESISGLSLSDTRLIACNDQIADFLSWIISTHFSATDQFGHSAPIAGFHNPVRRVRKIAERNINDPNMRPHNDKSMRWVTQIYPELAAWRSLAVDWMSGQTGPTKPRLQALQCFFREFIIGRDLPTVPEQFFHVSAKIPDFYTVCVSRRLPAFAKPWTTHIHTFTSWVLSSRLSVVAADGNRIVPEEFRNPINTQLIKSNSKTYDTLMEWVVRARPELEEWRSYAAQWLAQESKGLDIRLKALGVFFERYLIGQNLPTTPSFLLSRKSLVPDFYTTSCAKDGQDGQLLHVIQTNNRVVDFLDWVLKKHFSYEDDDGYSIVSPAFHNPVPYRAQSGGWSNRESVHSPLPFGFIEDMRLMLAQGPTFRDWTWAQNALGGETGVTGGRGAGDWYSVNEKDIDKDDPDCVWRVRTYEAGNTELQMWSPVRWVALLVKLQIPLRMLQVRLLDSGEADTWRYSNASWAENKSGLAEGTERKPLAQGVFRRVDHLKGVTAPTIMYVNTNKTADQKKSGPAKGYEVAWPSTGPIHQNPFYWLERLRNWQEKYNPIKRRTSWSELGTTHIPLKSDEQIATYPDACFLFRTRELPIDERHLPLSVTAMNKPWYLLLSALQERLRASGQSDSGGSPFLLVPPFEESNRGVTTYFPLQSLRVSLITALALDGQVPFPILQKLVGHSRLLMTLYYTKLGPTFVANQLEMAAARLDASKAGSIKRFVADARHDELMKKVVYNSAAGVSSAIAEDPGARNPAGWMLMHHGMCIVGGNTSEVEENKKIGGCHNGGPNVGTEMAPKWAPVPGGSRNCVRCRWFMTQPQYLPSLVATFNNRAYHFDEARNSCIAAEEKLQDFKRKKFESESEGKPFQGMEEYLELERLHEAAMKRFSDLAETLVATWRLIDRCSAALKEELAEGNQLIAVGATTDISVAFDETESELLQLSGVCEGVEVYPDLEAGKAVFRRSQLLDLVLMREGTSPVFITMSEADQLSCGNAFMRQLASQASPTNPPLGVRRVVELIDAGAQVGQMLGVDLATLIPAPDANTRKVIPIRPLRGVESSTLETN
jgi:hypothetical protein